MSVARVQGWFATLWNINIKKTKEITVQAVFFFLWLDVNLKTCSFKLTGVGMARGTKFRVKHCTHEESGVESVTTPLSSAEAPLHHSFLFCRLILVHILSSQFKLEFPLREVGFMLRVTLASIKCPFSVKSWGWHFTYFIALSGLA